MSTWLKEFYPVSPDRQLTLLYLANHELQLSLRKCGTLYVDLFAEVLGEALRIVITRGAGYAKKAYTVFNVIAQRKVFDTRQLERVRTEMEGKGSSSDRGGKYDSDEEGLNGDVDEVHDVVDLEAEAKAADELDEPFRGMFKTTMAIAESEIEVHLLGNKFQLLHDKVSAVENELEKNAKAASDSNGVEQSEDGEGKSSTFADPLGEDFETKIVEDVLEIDADAAMSLIEEYSERLTQKIEERSKVLEEAGECLERARSDHSAGIASATAHKEKCEKLAAREKRVTTAISTIEDEKRKRQKMESETKPSNPSGWAAFSQQKHQNNVPNPRHQHHQPPRMYQQYHHHRQQRQQHQRQQYPPVPIPPTGMPPMIPPVGMPPMIPPGMPPGMPPRSMPPPSSARSSYSNDYASGERGRYHQR